MAGFSGQSFAITLVVISVLLSPLSASYRRRSQLDTVYQPHSRRSYVRMLYTRLENNWVFNKSFQAFRF